MFLNSFFLSRRQRAFIEKNLKRDGNLLIWMYAPGIVDEDSYALEHVSELTDLKLESLHEWRKQRIEMVNHAHPICAALEGSDLSDFGSVAAGDAVATSPELDKVCPQIFVSGDDRDAVVLGVQEGTERAAFAVKSCRDYTSVYAAAAVLPAPVMRALLKWRGIETHTDSLDNFYTNGDLVGLNSLRSEYKTIRFGDEFQLEDLITGEVHHSRNRKVSVWVRYQDTFLGRVSRR